MLVNPSKLSVSGSVSKDSDDMQNISEINLNASEFKNDNSKSMKKQNSPNVIQSKTPQPQNNFNSFGQKVFASEKNVSNNVQNQKNNKCLSRN